MIYVQSYTSYCYHFGVTIGKVRRLVFVKSILCSFSPPILKTKDARVHIHPKSVNSVEKALSTRWVVYHLMMKTAKVCLITVNKI